ncbi:MAG: glycosyltransferase, partial [Phycisphaerales bacterium]|nr:glycosyltransferase [Phycisphaerales bacterium]
HRRPDRLLFASPDVTTGGRAVYRAYYDEAGDAAVTAPPVDGPTLDARHADRGRLAGSTVVPPADPERSPYRGFRGGPAWVRLIARSPSPYWRLARRRGPAATDAPAARVAALVRPAVAADPGVRALVVGCFDGTILGDLKRLTKWDLTGLETNASAADAARAKGHHVFPCSAQDAFTCLPDGLVYDLIVVPDAFEHWGDPPWVLRRLLRLLAPGGRIVIRTPNLDSLLLARFGPTWWHWQLPYHRTLVGRRGLRLVAAAADLRVEKLRTVTDAYPAAASVQLNRVGLAGVVPEGAAFPADVSAEGARLAGWARLLWDRFGRGDEMWAVLRPV